MSSAKQKNVLITGATSGVGLACAELFAKMGYRVWGTTSDATKHSDKNFDFNLLQMSLAKADEIETVLNELEQKQIQFDLIVCNGGIGEIGSIEHTPLEKARHMFEVNYWGHVQIIQKLLPEIKKNHSSVVFLGSVVYSLPFPFKAQYSASKSALSAFALALRQELKPYKNHVYLLEPGWIRSGFHNSLKVEDPKTSPYFNRLAPFTDHARDHQKKYPDGQKVAELILRLFEKKPRKTRWAVGPDAKLFFAVRRIFTWKIFEKFFLDRY